MRKASAVRGIRGARGFRGTRGVRSVRGTRRARGVRGVRGTRRVRGARGVRGVKGVRLQSQNVVSNYKITFRAEWNVDKPSIWLNCALSDKSTEVGRGRFACFELIRCGATVGSGGLGPRPCPNMVKN